MEVIIDKSYLLIKVREVRIAIEVKRLVTFCLWRCLHPEPGFLTQGSYGAKPTAGAS